MAVFVRNYSLLPPVKRLHFDNWDMRNYLMDRNRLKLVTKFCAKNAHCLSVNYREILVSWVVAKFATTHICRVDDTCYQVPSPWEPSVQLSLH